MKTVKQLSVSPAPWTRGNRKPYCQGGEIRCWYKREDGSEHMRIVAHCNEIFSEKQAEVDARLIAAAPDLYEALRECLSALNSVGGMGWDSSQAAMIKRNAVKALEKAGGGK